MKEKTFNYTLRYYLFQMGRVKTLTIFSCLFGVLGFPLLCIGTNLMNFSRDFDDVGIPMMIISYISMTCMALLSFITPIAVLKHLYTKTSADNILSLPLTATQRFIGDIATILSSYCLPMLMSAILSFAGESITVAVLDKKVWGADDNYYQYAFIAFFATLEFIALNTAITTCCGRMAEAILYPFAINIMLPLTIVFGGMIAYHECYGVYDSGNEILYSVVMSISPFGLLFTASSLVKMIMWGLIFSVIYFALAYFGYTKRLAQNIGKPFVFRHSYLITSTFVGLSFIVCYTWLSELAPFRGDNIPTTLLTIGIILLIMMLVMEVLNYRKIHSLPKFSLHFASTLGGGLLICFLLLLSKGFGAGYYVPDVKKVETASLSGFYREEGWENGVANDIIAIDETAISLVLEEQQLLIDNYDPDKYTDEQKYTGQLGYTIFNTSFSYTMKDGSNIWRNYSTDVTVPDLWERIFQTESYRLARLPYIDFYSSRLADEAEVRLANRHSNKIYMTFIQEDLFESELYKALEADLKADTEYGRHDENSVGVLYIGQVSAYTRGLEQYDDFNRYTDVVIYESYTNTIEVLKKHGTVPTAEEATEDSTKGSEVFMLYRMKANGIDIAAEEVFGTEVGSSAVFITAEEFKDLTSKQVRYNKFDGDDEYVYYLVPKMWHYMQNAPKQDIINALEKDGMGLDNYDFLEIGTNYGVYYINSMINTEYNDLCASIFESRTEFLYNETEIGVTITTK